MHSGYIYSSAAGYMLGIWILALTSLNFFIGCDVMGESYWRELYLGELHAHYIMHWYHQHALSNISLGIKTLLYYM